MAGMAERGDESPSLLDPATVRDLLHRLEATDVDELEIVRGGTRLYLRRQPEYRGGHLPASAPETVPVETGAVIAAPLTGIYYGRPSPEQPAFVDQGDVIETGQVVALIETMKLFNEVTADIAGEVTRITVADNDLVELGQTLMYVQPLRDGATA